MHAASLSVTRGGNHPSVCGLTILHALRSIRDEKKKRKDKPVPVISGTLQRTLSAGQAKHASHSGRVLLLLRSTTYLRAEYGVLRKLVDTVLRNTYQASPYRLLPSFPNHHQPFARSRLFPLSPPSTSAIPCPIAFSSHTNFVASTL